MQGLPGFRGSADAQGLCQPVSFRDAVAFQHALVGRKSNDVDFIPQNIFQPCNPGMEVLRGDRFFEIFSVGQVPGIRGVENKKNNKKSQGAENTGARGAAAPNS